MENQMKISEPPANMMMTPSYAQGLPVLLVDHDIASLTSLASMLEKCSYKVTTVKLARPAISMIRKRQNAFKLVIANVKMPDMDNHSFVTAILEKNIPLICEVLLDQWPVMSSEMKRTTAATLLEEGASFCLEKPVSMNEIRYLWQHAFQAKDNKTTENNNPNEIPESPLGFDYSQNKKTVNGSEKNQETGLSGPGSDKDIENRRLEISKGKRPIGIDGDDDDDETDGKNVKRAKIVTVDKDEKCTESDVTVCENVGKDVGNEKEGEGEGSGIKSRGKRRSVWTPDLHRKFTAAVSALGDKHARPKSILRMMNVPNLTQRQVASHLQKYKAQVQRISEMTTTTNDWKSSNETYDYPSNYSYPFAAAKLAETLFNATNSSSTPNQWTKGGFQPWKEADFILPNSQNQAGISSTLTGATSADRQTEFSLGGKINLSSLPMFPNINPNNGPEIFSPTNIPYSMGETVNSAGSYIPPADSNLMDYVPDASSYNFTLPDPVPSATSCVFEPDFDMMGFVSETDLDQIGLVQPDANFFGPPSSLVPSAASNNYMAPDATFDLTDPVLSTGSNVLEASLVPPLGTEYPDLDIGGFGDFQELLCMDSTNCVGGEPAPGEDDPFFNWLSDALDEDDGTAQPNSKIYNIENELF